MVIAGYKRTEVGVIPEDWGAAQVKDYVRFEGGSQPDKRYFSHGDGEGYIRLVQIRDYKTDNFITFVPERLTRKFCSKKDIMIGRYGPPIFQILRGIDGAYNVALIKCVLDDNIDYDYFYYFICNDNLFQLMDALSRRSSGQTGVELGALKNYPLPLPSMKEQKAIAGALSDVDGLIAGLEAVIAKKRSLKTATMQQLLTGKTRLAGFGAGKGMKQTELGEIPEDWEVAPLLDHADFIHGKAHEQNIVDDGPFKVVNSKFISTEGKVSKYSDVSFCTARNHDVLMVLSDLPNGKALAKCYMVNEADRYAVNQRVCIFRGRRADPAYLYYLLNRNPYFLALDDGVSQTHILNGDVKSCKIQFPPTLNEQKAIAGTLSDIDKDIAKNELRLMKTKALKQGMMQELLTGRTRLI